MEIQGRGFSSSVTEASEEEMKLRRGPWTVEEDLLLINYITVHGEGRWNALARSSGLNRTGKSCRLRWLNYLRPEIRRGNITPEEQLLILELHSKWGNRWSKIAAHLPGRTDNEIKNYWRTRVQKQARQLNCDVNSKKFRDAMHYLWMPRLRERISAAAAAASKASGDLDNNHPSESNQEELPWRPSIAPESSVITSAAAESASPELQTTQLSSNSECSCGQSQVIHLDVYNLSGNDGIEQAEQYNNCWSTDDLMSNQEQVSLPSFEQCGSLDDFWNVDDAWFTQLMQQ